MRTKIENKDDYDFYIDEEGFIQAEKKVKSLNLSVIEKYRPYYEVASNQFSQKSAMKVKLFSKIQAIADYANDGWKPDWNDHNQMKYYVSRYGIKFENCNGGQIFFKSKELAQQAIDDNPGLFEEFLDQPKY